MKALAHSALKSPLNAMLIGAVSAAFPLTFWLAAAIVGLVTLRKGQSEGLKVLVASLAGAVAGMLGMGDFTPYIPAMLMCPVIVILALVLRNTESWAMTLVSGSVAGIILAVVARYALAAPFAQINQILIESAKQSGQSQAYLELFTMMAREHALPILMAGGTIDLTIAVLVLARSWQAQLFNPGGFRQEFHQLRLAPWMVTGLLVAAVPVYMWNHFAVEPVLMPFIVAGTALAHGAVSKKDLGRVWLVAFYAALLLFTPYMLPLLVLATSVDAWLDLRARIKPGS